MTNEKKTQYTPTTSEMLRDKLTKELEHRQTARQTAQTDRKTDEKTARQTDRRQKAHETLKTVEDAFLDGTMDEHTNELQLLSYIIALTVLNKCISVSDNDTLRLMKTELIRAKKTLEKIVYNGGIASELKPNKDGILKSIVLDKSSSAYLSAASHENLGGDGLDLMQVAILSLYSEYEKAKAENRLVSGWLENPYNTRKLSRKVYIDESKKPEFETVETTAIQQCYKTVRKEIQSNKALSFNSGYSYVSMTTTDELSGIDEIIYKRYGKYADIGGYTETINGQTKIYTADETTAETMETLVQALNLTARQTAILEYRLKGYGNKAIANTLNITKDTVKDHLKKIRKTATNSDIFKGKISEKALEKIVTITLENLSE